jgi:DNA-directed RNA polymerase subunit F
MAIPKVVNEEPINLSMLKDYMKKIKKRDEELSYRATKVEEYVTQFSILKKKDAEELYKALEDLNISRLRATHLHKIIDIRPETIESLKTMFAGTPTSLSAENTKKIIDTVKKFVDKK